MLEARNFRRWRVAQLWAAWLVIFCAWALLPPTDHRAWGQDTGDGDVAGPGTEFVETEVGSEDAGQEVVGELIRTQQEEGINFFSLLVKGGWFMLPIGALSLVVVTIAIERALSLRRSRVLPEALVQQLGRMAGSQGTFDPREAYRICQSYPSAAANVVRAMVLKVGRPHSEVEHTVAEASEREAERLYANVRWLNLAAGVAPLLGLLGTVWGMIDAFHRTTILGPGQNKAEALATGIYLALVTTFGGLMIAIPAAIFAHLFEGRIQKLFHQIDEMLFNLLPQIERLEGRMRFGQSPGEPSPGDRQLPGPPKPPEVAASSSRTSGTGS